MPSPLLDTSKAHPARRYNYWLGGKDNFAADRESGDAIARLYPAIVDDAVGNRLFSERAVRWLASEHGVDQFLDVGTGIPVSGYDSTHGIAQRIHPAARVVYVDNDPLVLTHARALLTGSAEGATAYIDADLRRPEQILTDDALIDTLDLTRPVGLLLVAVLHFLPDDFEAYAAVRALVDALAPGSFLVLSHASLDLVDEQTRAAFAGAALPGVGQFTSRTKNQVLRFFDGLQLVEPGLAPVNRWCPPDGAAAENGRLAAVYGGVALKPGSALTCA